MIDQKLTDYEQILILKMSLEWKKPEKIADKVWKDISDVISYLSKVTKNSDASLTETSFKEIVLHYENLMKKLEIKKEGMSQINNYTEIFEKYMKTSVKPDKKYSMLYTTINSLELNKDDIVLDVWCGAWYFTIPLSKVAKKVIWIDNNATQIKSANNLKQEIGIENIEYIIEDMRTYEYPESYFSCINAPFVINYSKTLLEMKKLFQKRYASLQKWWKLFAIMDNPSDIVHNNKRFWSIKIFPWKQMVDWAIVEMMLYNWDEHLCTLYSCFYNKEIWFTNIQRKDPSVSSEWIEKEWWDFRSEYMKNCDVMYLSANKE